MKPLSLHPCNPRQSAVLRNGTPIGVLEWDGQWRAFVRGAEVYRGPDRIKGMLRTESAWRGV